MNRHDKYILDELGDPRPVADILVWAEWFEKADRHLAKEEIPDPDGSKVIVSTVFLALDHNFTPDGPALLWETMVFGGRLSNARQQYAERSAAQAGHAEAVEAVRSGATTLWGEDFSMPAVEPEPVAPIDDSARLDWLERSTHVAEEVRNQAAAEFGWEAVDGPGEDGDGPAAGPPMTFREMVDGLMRAEEKEGQDS